MTARTLLLVDDDPAILRGLKWSFDDCEVHTASDRESALAQVKAHRPAVVTLDLGLPPAPDDAVEGLRTLAEILALAPETKVIVVTGNEERAHAVRAIALGAYDFYQKPIDGHVLSLIVKRAFNVSDLEAENRRLQQARDPSFQGIVTGSDAMLALCRTVEKVAPTDIGVLLLGESGTGKELFARALHNLSPRRRAPFVAINCAAIPENLLESELFGHERGAFTGAVRQVKGKIELAQKGTLFLDEIGDMPMSLQVKLLRFLQERVIERVGGREQIAVDVRIVCATHQDLEANIHSGAFREDLFYRIGEMALTIPPLRDRDDDCILLARHLIDKFSADHGRRKLQLGPDAIAALRHHRWMGNVRELENRIKRAVILADGQSITAPNMGLSVPGGEVAEVSATLQQARDEAERKALSSALALSAGNLSAAAKILGVSRPTIYSLLKQHNVNLPS
ncbi:Fis family transcriptional regulator [Skermanella stibiiresistens SB22]|uniref:Fis family transcriptional regulator n=1 Tax=Skermanella stibiiresistens SB22 TaxID=1385369 RepID=W9H4X8_9PROT|nr:PEP-CTERM-box response regulator transcription factor [Skermanella stibiiresistens]EWY41280.1 Fis family transcriptional regulator [Skermanella stibiiresistens SB22]